MGKIESYVLKAYYRRYSFLQIITGVLAFSSNLLMNSSKRLCANAEKWSVKAGRRSLEKYLVNTGEQTYYNIKGVKLSEISRYNFDDILLIHCFYNDNYDREIVDKLEKYTGEGPYCYKNGNFDVTVKEDDIVIDVGASVGEFCAYTAYRKAKCYAFEPVEDRYEKLCKTARLNAGYIFPVKMGLSDASGTVEITTSGIPSPSFVLTKGGTNTESIQTITLDQFVEENKITKVDFIKSDVEGAERNLLRGSVEVLRTFAPKLSICTYHLPDDPEVLAKIIIEANPKYKIVQLKSKLYAST